MTRIGHWIGYTFWIIKEILVAGVTATAAGFKRDPGIEPIVIFYPLRVTSDWDIFWFTTSITVTPGTMSIGLRHATAPGEPETLIVQAAFGSDPVDIIEGLIDMEEHVNPQVKATLIDAASVSWEPYIDHGDTTPPTDLPPAERME